MLYFSLLNLGGGITKEDLRLYQTRVRDPIVGKLKHLGLTMYSPEPPSGGVVLQYLLRLVDGNRLNHNKLGLSINAVMLFTSNSDPLLPCLAFSCIVRCSSCKLEHHLMCVCRLQIETPPYLMCDIIYGWPR